MKPPRSLRLRLLLGAAVAIFAALALAWFAMSWLFERHIERRLVADLERNGMQLVAALTIDAQGQLLIARLPGDTRFEEPASGLYWQLAAPGTVLRSRSLWDQDLPATGAVRADAWQDASAPGPFEPEVLMVEREVRLGSEDIPVRVQLAHENQSLHEARAEFGRELAVFLLLLWLILSLAAWLQVALGLAPLERIRDALAALKRHPGERLTITEASEIEPLARAINELADARETDLARARHRAADLAHSLKTPLAAMAAESRRARREGAADAADGLDRAIAAMGAAVESELARSRAASLRAGAAQAGSAPLPVIEQILGVIERTESGARLVFDVEVPATLRVPVATEDLTELLGALIENGARHARRRLRVRGRALANAATLAIDDDGAGLASADAAEAVLRGRRLDESGAGHGLGLAIARDYTEATGGHIALERSDLGGLSVVLTWPSPA